MQCVETNDLYVEACKLSVKIPAQLLRRNMLLFLNGYLFVVMESESHGDRQLSTLLWSGIGNDPGFQFRQMRHGLKHGYQDSIVPVKRATFPLLQAIAQAHSFRLTPPDKGNGVLYYRLYMNDESVDFYGDLHQIRNEFSRPAYFQGDGTVFKLRFGTVYRVAGQDDFRYGCLTKIFWHMAPPKAEVCIYDSPTLVRDDRGGPVYCGVSLDQLLPLD